MSYVQRAAEYDAQNREAALAILENVERYEGETAGVVKWARLWLSRHGSGVTAKPERAKRGQIEMFGGMAA